MQAAAIVIVDSHNDISFVNNAAERLFGQPATSLLGAPFGFPVVAGEVAQIDILRPQRGLAVAEMRAVPMSWKGQQQHLLFIQDISDHKRAEQDLRKLSAAVEQSPSSVVITDVDGAIEYVNPKFTDTTGYTLEEAVGENPRILKSGHMGPEEYADLWRTISSGMVWRGELHNKKRNGDLFWELASIAPVRDDLGNVTHYVAVKEDITDRKATEARLRQAQKLEVIGQLTGGIAHDFNNLLGIVLGNLQLLEELVESPDQRELVTDAIWSAERGAQLTHRLLAFARRQRLHPKVTDLNHVISEMTGLLRRTLGQRIAVRERLADDLWHTMIDRGQLESALLNLVVNARDAMPDGGTLTISTENVRGDRLAVAEEQEEAAGEYAMIAVTDTGAGMAPDVIQRIFEPFFTTKKFGEGSGMGLSMVYGFVRQSGGHIAVDSEVGRGTTIKVFLPKARPDQKPSPTALDVDASLAEEAGSDEVILVVEDEERVRKTAVRILQHQGYQVHDASTAEEALRLVDELPRLDLMFTDVVLPAGMNGPELVRRVCERRPDVRILLTSGYAQNVGLRDLLATEPVEFLEKPYRRELLTGAVRAMLTRVPS